jgi:hypothetical protein
VTTSKPGSSSELGNEKVCRCSVDIYQFLLAHLIIRSILQ